MLRQTNNPRPVPWPISLVEWKGSKIRSRSAAGTPGPVSPTSMTIRSPSRRVATVTSLRDGASVGSAWYALTIRLSTTWTRRASFPITGGVGCRSRIRRARASTSLPTSLEHRVHDLADVDADEAAFVGAAEASEVAGDAGDPARARSNRVQPFAEPGERRAGVGQRRPLQVGQQLVEHVDLAGERITAREHVGERIVDLVRHRRRERSQRHHAVVLDRLVLQLADMADVVRQGGYADHLPGGASNRGDPGLVHRLAHLDRVPERIARQTATDVSRDRGVGPVHVEDVLAHHLARLHPQGRQPGAFGHGDDPFGVRHPERDRGVVARERKALLHQLSFGVDLGLLGDVERTRR